MTHTRKLQIHDLIATHRPSTVPGARAFQLGPLDCAFSSDKLNALIGRNGAGKTTLLKSIVGIQPRQSGTLLLDDRALSPHDIAWLPQGAFTPAWYTVTEVLLFGRYPLHRGFPGRSDQLAIERALADLGISEFAGRALASLSSGELQKIHIARALAAEARVLLFDEPTANLDVAAAREVMKLLRDLTSRTHCIIIFASHDLALIEDFATQVSGIRGGQLAATWCDDDVRHESLVEFFTLS